MYLKTHFEKKQYLSRLDHRKLENELLDKDGLRSNVGIVIVNSNGESLLFRRDSQSSWQFPQGGIDAGETPKEAMYRELEEEVGLKREHVKYLAQTKDWYDYVLPKRLLNQAYGRFVGQKQKWFLLHMLVDESYINFHSYINESEPEFEEFMWVKYWYPVREIVNFKREVYSGMLTELCPALKMFLLNIRNNNKLPVK